MVKGKVLNYSTHISTQLIFIRALNTTFAPKSSDFPSEDKTKYKDHFLVSKICKFYQ